MDHNEETIRHQVKQLDGCYLEVNTFFGIFEQIDNPDFAGILKMLDEDACYLCRHCDLINAQIWWEKEEEKEENEEDLKVGDIVIFRGVRYPVLGFAASEDLNGKKLVEIAWDNYELSPSGYLAIPRAYLR